MKRIISIGFAALVMLSALVVLDIGPVGEVEAELNPPHDNGTGRDPKADDNIWNTDGDWVIESGETIVHSNKTIIVNGNLTIWDDATLTLQNVTLLMNCSFNGEFNITVKSPAPFGGGLLIIEDLDGDPLTSEDASIITSNVPDGQHRFGFVVEGINGAIEMRNSELHECGWDSSETDFRDRGLRITNFAEIENNTISNCYTGLILYYAEDPIIKGNYIHNCTVGSGILIANTGTTIGSFESIGPNNTITNCYWGINMDSSTHVNIHNNTIISNGIDDQSGGLGVSNSDNITIQDNNITANAEYSVNIENSDDIKVLGNELNGTTDFTRFDTVDGLEIKDNYLCQGGENVTIAYLLVYDVLDCIFDNNMVNDNVGIGAVFTMSEIDVLNNRFENNGAGGFTLQLATYGGLVHNNTVRFNQDMGAHIVGNDIIISNNWFEGNGDGNPYMGDPMFQDCGLDVMNSENITISNNWFYENVRTNPTGHVDGIYLFGQSMVTTVYMEHNILHRNNINLHCRGGVTAIDCNSTYNRSLLVNPTPYDVYLEEAFDAFSENHITFLNTTFDNSSVYVNCDFTVQWYKHIRVEDNLGNPISGASIWINDSFSNPEGVSGATTDSDGRLKFIPLTEYVEDNSGRTYHTPHTIDVIDSTRIGYDEANMWHSHFNTIVLNERPTVTDLFTEHGATGNVYRTDTIWIIVVGTDLEDIIIDLIPHIEFRVNETSPWNDESSSYLGSWIWDPQNGWWAISFSPPVDAIIDSYGFRVRFEDTYPSYSDWYIVDDMIDVMNNPPDTIWIGEDKSTVYRGQSAFIFADGDDIEDNSEDDTWDAECQFRLNLSSTWSDTYITGSVWDNVASHWRFEFEPPATSPLPNPGPVDFRVRFMDSEGTWNITWYEVMDLVYLLNNLPVVIDMKPGYSDVYRGESVWIFVNASDAEDDPEDLIAEFWWDAPGGGEVWEQGGLGNVLWDPSGFFKVMFTPDNDALEGYYKFKVRIRDNHNDYDELIENAMLNVINQPPVLINITPSAQTVVAGSSYIFLHINASDYEDNEDELILTVQWQYNETGPQGWSGAYIIDEPYDGTAPDGWLKVRFTPDATMQIGHYDFRAKVEDTDGYESVNPEWIAIYKAVEVLNSEPTLEDVALQDGEVYRGQNLEIHLNAEDFIDHEPELTPEIEWLAPFGFWTGISPSAMYYEDTNANANDNVGYWVIEFTPPSTASLGEYQFRARVRNSGGGVSDGGEWETGTKWDSLYGNRADVLNNVPSASNLRIIGTSTVIRGDYIFIYADGEDFEDDEDDLTPYFEYSTDGSNWYDDELISDMFESGEDSWRITFTPPEDETFALGDYDFRVWFEDEDGDVSNIVEVSDLVEVENAPPSVVSLNIPESDGYRMESITLIADGKDDDHGESALEAIFEYKGPNDSDWTGSDDTGTYFGSPTYFNGHWQIVFEPPADAEVGDYSFRVAFSDGINTTAWMEKIDTYELLNEPPEVEIISPDSGAQSSTTLTFTVDVNDDKDTDFDYEWDFDDGETSTEASPDHTFNPGTYSVIVSVTDSDGGYTTKEINITIPEDFDGDGIVDDIDSDDDNDGVPDTEDAFPKDPNEHEDSDLDGIGNNADTDDDNDNVPDSEDDFPINPNEHEDTDLDGIGNNADTDDDNDNVPDSEDDFPLDPNESKDTDLDEIGDNADTDDDNDDVPDAEDDFPLDPNESKDTDGDGIGDNKDTDDDGDGTPDIIDPDPLDPGITEKEEFDWLTPFLLIIIIVLLIVILFLLLTMRKMKYIDDIPQEPEVRRIKLEPEKEIPSEEPSPSELDEGHSPEVTEEEPPSEPPTTSEEPTEKPPSENASSSSENHEIPEPEESHRESGQPPPPPPPQLN